jgi:predicted TIM-barrel fold metal-dependent hydrolase
MQYTGPIIDAHHHIWRLADIPWLAGPIQPRIFGDYRAMQRDYLIEDFMADVKPCGVVGSVYVQANWPADRSAAEVAWVQSVANASGWPQGIVGYADLAAPDVEGLLDRQLEYRNLRGIRQQIHWHEQTLYKFAARPDWMNDPAWRRGLRAIGRRGLVFELQVFESQMADSVRLVRDFPEVSFVLLHVGMLEDRSVIGWEKWREGVRALATCPNVVTKLSGLGTFVRACSVELFRPIIEEAIAIYGPERCLYGSNFPVERLWTDYPTMIRVMRESLSSLTQSEQGAVFHDNAVRVYRLHERKTN